MLFCAGGTHKPLIVSEVAHSGIVGSVDTTPLGVSIVSIVSRPWRTKGGLFPMAKKKPVHVTPRDDGWAVMREGNQRASSVHPTQKEAEKVGRQAARKDRTEFVLHNRQGEIRQRDSYGDDPRSRKG